MCMSIDREKTTQEIIDEGKSERSKTVGYTALATGVIGFAESILAYPYLDISSYEKLGISGIAFVASAVLIGLPLGVAKHRAQVNEQIRQKEERQEDLKPTTYIGEIGREFSNLWNNLRLLARKKR